MFDDADAQAAFGEQRDQTFEQDCLARVTGADDRKGGADAVSLSGIELPIEQPCVDVGPAATKVRARLRTAPDKAGKRALSSLVGKGDASAGPPRAHREGRLSQDLGGLAKLEGGFQRLEHHIAGSDSKQFGILVVSDVYREAQEVAQDARVQMFRPILDVEIEAICFDG